MSAGKLFVSIAGKRCTAKRMLTEKRLGTYLLLREAGRGAMSTVYEAVDTRLGRTVALKVLAVSPYLPPAERDALVTRIQREARAIASLSHPRVVTIFDVGEQDGLHYLVMEFLDGVTLRARLDNGPLSPDETADILVQVAEGLDAVHTRGVLHRDLKPSNVMLLPGGRVKLMDFGVARAADDTTMTRAGTMVGSPAYMAPELIHGEKATSASDIWALGVLLYEMLAGRPPFAAEALPGVLYQIAHTEPAPLAHVSPAIAAVLERALEKDPAKRFESARALADAFQAEVAPVQPAKTAVAFPAPVEDTLPPQPPRRPLARAATERVAAEARPLRRRGVLRPVAAAAAAVFLIGGVFAVARRMPQRGVAVPAQEPAQQTGAASPPPGKAAPAPAGPPAGKRREVTASAPARTEPARTKPASPTTLPDRAAPILADRDNDAPQQVRTDNDRGAAKRPSAVALRDRGSAPLPPRNEPARSQTRSQNKSPEGQPDDAERRRDDDLPPAKTTSPSAADRSTPPPVESVETDAPRRPMEVGDTRAHLRDLLGEWIAATNARDIEGQMRFYPPRVSNFYTQRNVSRAAVRAEKVRIFGRAASVDMHVSAPQITLDPDGGTAAMRFRKRYAIVGGPVQRRGEVLQELRWRRMDGGWKIISERDLQKIRG